MENLIGKAFGPYRIIAALGEGGMATVFKAYQASMERHVAVKVLPRQLAKDPQFVGRFKQEAMVLAQLQHPHILPVFDFGEEEGYTYLVTPLVQSGALKALLRGEPLSLARIRRLVSQLGDALDYAHSQGLVHRDVKPSNVLLDERENCLLTDFGIAKILAGTSEFTSTGGLVGTPAYMSPEQGRGDEVDARTDIYALGVLLYEMATGHVPFEADTPVAVIFKHIEEPLPPPRTLNPALPPAVEAVILKALAKAPQERYATAGEMVQALRAATAGKETGPVTLPAPRPAEPPVREKPIGIEQTVRQVRPLQGGVLPFTLLTILAVGASLFLSARYAPDHGFLNVPFASWFVFLLGGLTLALNGAAFYFWRQFRRADRELIGLVQEPLEDEIPAVYGHRHLVQAEFLSIIQILFRHPFNARYIQVRPLPGGYGGGTTVLVKLRRERQAPPLPRSLVVKLGHRREMADEHAKFQRHVLADLPQAARFFRYAAWEAWAGIAYEFVGLDPNHEIQNFYQFYRGYATVEVAELVERIYQHLDRAWYRNRRAEPVDLYREYGLLDKKREAILGNIGEIVEEGDSYRANLTTVARRLQPNLKPAFCPDLEIPWYDPVAFMRTWAGRELKVSIYRSVVHGDLNARNVLVEVERNGAKRIWFIDFSHTGNGLSAERAREALQEGRPRDVERGPTLQDFGRLEADVKFILTRLRNEADLTQAVAFEKALMGCGLALYDLSTTAAPVEALQEERFARAWQTIRAIRRQAAAHLTHLDDMRPYYLSLLSATLPIVYYHPDQFEDPVCEQQQKRYALLSAGMLCHRL